MKSSRPVLAALTVCLLPLLSGVGAEELAYPFKRLALLHVTVVDVSNGELLTDRTVVVEGDRITAVGPAESVEVPAGARVVEGSGKYLIPGLWDMHVHLYNQLSGRPPNRWHFPLLVANGVTGVREMWTKPEDVPTLDRWRNRAAEGELVAPRIGAAGWLVDGPHSWWKTTDRVAMADEARRFARQVHKADLDFVKVYSMLPREAYFALVEEATRLGLPVAGHVPLTVRVTEAANAGQRSNEHLHQVREACSGREATVLIERSRLYGGAFTTAEDDSLWERHKGLWTETYDTSVCSTVARKLADAGMWQVPTLVNERGHFLGPEEGAERDPRLAYLPPDERRFWREGLGNYTDIETNSQGGLDERLRRWEVTKEVVAVLARGGVPFLAGTDLGAPGLYPGFSLHEELALLVEAGLTPAEALRAATLEPARYLEATDSLGTVEAGKLADLVLLDANPLEDITNTREIVGVVVDGRYLDREALDQLLAEAEEAARHSRDGSHDETSNAAAGDPVSIARSTGESTRAALAGGSDADGSQQQPLVCIDEGHQERHRAGGTYSLFTSWLRDDGFRVEAFTAPLKRTALRRCRVLVMANALHVRNQGDWALPTPSAFTPEEIEEVRRWVVDGGGLLLIADHMPFPGAARDLGDAFGLRFSNGFAVDTAVDGRSYGPYRGTSRFVFRDRDGSLAAHPITEGLDGSAHLDSVVTYTGQVFRAHGRYQPLLVAPAGTISLLPQEAWQFDEQTPVLDTGGWLQGGAAEFGAGRVVALGEAAQFRPGPNGEARGDNAAFAKNVVRWLAGLEAP